MKSIGAMLGSSTMIFWGKILGPGLCQFHVGPLNQTVCSTNFKAFLNLRNISDCCTNLIALHKSSDVLVSVPEIFTVYTRDADKVKDHVSYTSRDGKLSLSYCGSWRIQHISSR